MDRGDGDDHVEDLLEREVVADLVGALRGGEQRPAGGHEGRGTAAGGYAGEGSRSTGKREKVRGFFFEKRSDDRTAAPRPEATLPERELEKTVD